MRRVVLIAGAVVALLLATACDPRQLATATHSAVRMNPPRTIPTPVAGAAPSNPADPGTAPAPAPGMDHGLMPMIDAALIPARGALTYTVPRQKAQIYPVKPGDGTGAFRISTNYSHFSYDDPIVYPGQPGRAHLHAFFGNRCTDAFTTDPTACSSAASDGGTLNKTAYWVPAVIDTATGAPIQPDLMQVYYKTGYGGVEPTAVQPFPAGLRIVAGDMSRTTPEPGPDYSHVTIWECDNGNGGSFDHLPTNCAPGTWLVMSVEFPQCWDGVNLDSPDHKSHMAYPVDGGCPASHPVPLPEITQRAIYTVPQSGTSTWRLSSDNYSGPAGYSAHADWFDGWDQATMQQWLNTCDRAAVDCQMDLLGNGQMLY